MVAFLPETRDGGRSTVAASPVRDGADSWGSCGEGVGVSSPSFLLRRAFLFCFVVRALLTADLSISTSGVAAVALVSYFDQVLAGEAEHTGIDGPPLSTKTLLEVHRW